MGGVGLISVRAIAWRGSRAPILVSWGPGPELPLSPILWHPRQPDEAATALPASSECGTVISISVGDPATAPSIVRYAIAAITVMPASVAIGRRSGLRSGFRSKKGSRIRRTMQMVGIPTVAMNTSAGGLTTRRSSKRKKKYHSGRGVYVVVVG